ncbi:MAG: apolipoprotein N-acyltransferase, partial [Methylobacterium sp.]
MFRYPTLSCLVLGAIAATGFAPLDWWPLTLLGLAAWMALVHAAPTFRASLWRGWMFGV